MTDNETINSTETPEPTATDLRRLRDDEQKPWGKVAEALGLGSPGAARRLYSALVRLHAVSVLAVRGSTRARVQPVHLADATLEQIREAITGSISSWLGRNRPQNRWRRFSNGGNSGCSITGRLDDWPISSLGFRTAHPY